MSRTVKVKRMVVTIKKLKKEIKLHLKTIGILESSRDTILDGWAKEVESVKTALTERCDQVQSDLSGAIDQLQDALTESKRKKWYQFIPIK